MMARMSPLRHCTVLIIMATLDRAKEIAEFLTSAFGKGWGWVVVFIGSLLKTHKPFAIGPWPNMQCSNSWRNALT